MQEPRPHLNQIERSVLPYAIHCGDVTGQTLRWGDPDIIPVTLLQLTGLKANGLLREGRLYRVTDCLDKTNYFLNDWVFFAKSAYDFDAWSHALLPNQNIGDVSVISALVYFDFGSQRIFKLYDSSSNNLYIDDDAVALNSIPFLFYLTANLNLGRVKKNIVFNNVTFNVTGVLYYNNVDMNNCYFDNCTINLDQTTSVLYLQFYNCVFEKGSTLNIFNTLPVIRGCGDVKLGTYTKLNLYDNSASTIELIGNITTVTFGEISINNHKFFKIANTRGVPLVNQGVIYYKNSGISAGTQNNGLGMLIDLDNPTIYDSGTKTLDIDSILTGTEGYADNYFLIGSNQPSYDIEQIINKKRRGVKITYINYSTDSSIQINFIRNPKGTGANYIIGNDYLPAVISLIGGNANSQIVPVCFDYIEIVTDNYNSTGSLCANSIFNYYRFTQSADNNIPYPVNVDGVTIIGKGTPSDPFVSIGGVVNNNTYNTYIVSGGGAEVPEIINTDPQTIGDTTTLALVDIDASVINLPAGIALNYPLRIVSNLNTANNATINADPGSTINDGITTSTILLLTTGNPIVLYKTSPTLWIVIP